MALDLVATLDEEGFRNPETVYNYTLYSAQDNGLKIDFYLRAGEPKPTSMDIHVEFEEGDE